MKTIKIGEQTHKELNKIKAIMGYKTLDETIDMCIGEYKHNCMFEKELKQNEK